MHTITTDRPCGSPMCMPSCIDREQMFPPGRSIWCNNRTADGAGGSGPTARPTALRGGHLCCRSTDYCNGYLRPAIVDYSKLPHSIFAPGDRASGRRVELTVSVSRLLRVEFLVFFLLCFVVFVSSEAD